MGKKLITMIIVAVLITGFLSSNVYAACDEPGVAEKIFSSIINGISDKLYSFIESMGADIDTIIYNTNPITEEDSKFKIEFKEGSKSPFSAMGLELNKVFTSISLIIMFIVLLILGSKYQISATTKNKVELSESAFTYLISFIMIYWLPEILNFVLFISNTIVEAFNPRFMGLSGGYISTIQNTGYLMDALVYAGSIALSLYFSFVYATRALHIALFFFLFPILATYMNSKKYKENFETFLSDLISTISIQIVDAALFYGLALLFKAGGAFAGNDGGFWKLVIAASIIPLRGIAKKYLGFSHGSMASDMMGFAGLMGAVGLAKGVVGGGRDLISGVGGGIKDITNSRKLSSNAASFAPGSNISAGAGGGSSEGLFYASGIGATSGTGYVPSVNSQMPDIKPYLNRSGGIDINQVDNVARSPLEAQDMLAKRGWGKIARSIGKTAGGTALGAYGAAMGTAFGPTGVIYGAQLGGILGAGLGEGAGALGGMMYNPYLSAQQGNANVDNKIDIDVNNLDAGAMVVASSKSMDINKDMEQTMPQEEEPVAISGPGVEDINIREKLNEYAENIPEGLKNQFANEATREADAFTKRFSGTCTPDQINEMKNVCYKSSMLRQVTDYSVEKLKNSNYNIDKNALDSMNMTVKEEMYKELMNELDSYKHRQDDINVDEVI